MRHNLRLGRADRRGAFRTAAVTAIATPAGGVWIARDPSEFIPFVGTGLGRALWAAVVPWTFYIALELYVRRVWPEMLIGWSRLISGRIRDPLVGRDLLVGIIGGVATSILVHLRILVPGWIGLATPSPLGSEGTRAEFLLTLANGGVPVAALPFSVTNGLFIGLLSAVTLVLLTMLLRGRRRAAVAWVVIWTLSNQVASPGDPIADLAYKAVVFTIGIVLLVRFGLLPSVVHLITTNLLTVIELRFDSVAPYSAGAYVLVGAVALLALYGFHTALAGRAVLGTVLLKEGPSVSR